MSESFQDRLLKEFSEVQNYREKNLQEYDQYIVSELIPDLNDDKILHCFVFGLKNTEHQNAVFRLKIKLPDNFPKQKPSVYFVEPCPIHPNISIDGFICLNKYSQWENKNYYIVEMLDYINFLLYNPNPKSCMNGVSGDQYVNNYVEYEKTCKQQSELSQKQNKSIIHCSTLT